MEQSEHRRAREMAAVGAWLIYEVGAADRGVLQQWLEIPNELDCHPYVMGLQDRFGKDRLHRVTELVKAAHQRTGLGYSEFQAAMLKELAKSGTVYLPSGLTRAPFGQLKVVEFPPEGSGRPVVIGECLTDAEALTVAGGAVWPNVRRVYDDRGSEVAFYAPSSSTM